MIDLPRRRCRPRKARILRGDETSEVLATLAKALIAADRARNDVVLRRLNRKEYENTIRDLFGVSVQVQAVLPPDTPLAGFDNVGEGLAVSAEAATAYLHAADLAARGGVRSGERTQVHHAQNESAGPDKS